MGAVLLSRAYRHDERGALHEALACCTRSHFLQTPGTPVLIHRGRLWVIVILAAGISAAEWLRQPAPVWVVIAWASVAALTATLWPLAGWRRRILAALVLVLAASLTYSQRRLTVIETRWPEERERRVTKASEHLDADLQSAPPPAERP